MARYRLFTYKSDGTKSELEISKLHTMKGIKTKIQKMEKKLGKKMIEGEDYDIEEQGFG